MLLSLCGSLPVHSGGGVRVVGCEVGGVSGEVESEMREGGESGSSGCSGDAVMGVDNEYEEGTGGTCEYAVGGVAM